MPIAAAVVAAPSRARDEAAAAPSWRGRHVAVLVAIGMVEGALRIAAPRDGDIFWGARSGLDTIRTGSISRHDGYSWSVPGHSWIPSSWGWNVVLGALYDVFGMAGFLVAAVAMGALLGAVVALVARKLDARPLPTAMVLTVVGAFALAGAPRATALSTVVALAVLLPVPAVLFHSRVRALRATVLLVLIQVVWINLHSGALFGPVLVGACGIGCLARPNISERGLRLLRLVVLVVLLGLSCLATPYGWSLIAHAPKVRAASVGLIEEWQHYSLGMLFTPTGIAGAAAVVIVVWTLVRSRSYDRLLPLLVVIALAVSAVRFTPMVLVFVLPELALALGRLPVRDVFMRAAAGVVALGLLGAAIGGLADFTHVKEMWGSPRLVHELPAGCRLFNDDVSGGTVILLRPDVPVWTDGRNDMYGRARAILTLSVLEWSPGSAAWLDREQITCALVPKSDRIARALKRRPGWRLVDTDSARALLIRSPAL